MALALHIICAQWLLSRMGGFIMNKKILFLVWVLMSWVGDPSYAFAEEAGSLKTGTSTEEKKEEKTTSRTIPEIEREFIGSSLGLGAGWDFDTGFKISGNVTRAFGKKISLGMTLGSDGYLNVDSSRQRYMLYGGNVRVLVLDNILNQSLNVAADLNYLNKKVTQLIRPGLMAKYVFKGTSHFLKSSLFFDKYFHDENYVNQFKGKSYVQAEAPLSGYETMLSYNYQLSSLWFLALQTSYSDHAMTKKDFSDSDFSIAHKQKLKLIPMVGLSGFVQAGVGYDFLNRKWGFEAATNLLQMVF